MNKYYHEENVLLVLTLSNFVFELCCWEIACVCIFNRLLFPTGQLKLTVTPHKKLLCVQSKYHNGYEICYETNRASWFCTTVFVLNVWIFYFCWAIWTKVIWSRLKSFAWKCKCLASKFSSSFIDCLKKFTVLEARGLLGREYRPCDSYIKVIQLKDYDYIIFLHYPDSTMCYHSVNALVVLEHLFCEFCE